MIPYDNRFHRRGSIKYVYAKGEIYRSRYITLKCVKNSRSDKTRIAVVISKKTIKGAVKRNSVRRRIYGYLNSKINNLSGVYDIVLIITSAEVMSLNSADLRQVVDELFNQAGLYKID